MSPRRTLLPARRIARYHRISFSPPGKSPVHRGFEINIAAGFMPGPRPDGGRLLEVFLHDQANRGSERDFMLDDLGVLISLLLQFGVAPKTLRRHLAAPSDGQAPSIAGAVVDALIDMQDDFLAEQGAGS